MMKFRLPDFKFKFSLPSFKFNWERALRSIKGIRWHYCLLVVPYMVSTLLAMISISWGFWASFCLVQTLVLLPLTCAWIATWMALDRKQNKKINRKFWYQTEEEWRLAVDYAYNKMVHAGFRLTDYVQGWKACEDYANAMNVYIHEWVYQNHDPKKGYGIPCATFGYTRKDKVGHVCIEIMLNNHGDRQYWEVYPYRGQLELTKKEIKSADWRNFIYGRG